MRRELFRIRRYTRRYDRRTDCFIVEPGDINPAAPAEVDEIKALFDCFFGAEHRGFIPVGMLKDKIVRQEVFVFKYEGKIIAVAIGRPGATLFNLFVHPAWRGKSLGKALLKYLNPKRVRVKYTIKDPTAFYEKCGYRFVEYAFPKSFWTRSGFHKKGSVPTIKIMEKQ